MASTSSTSIRMSGIVSGLDTDSIIKNLMKAEKAPLNKLLQKKQSEEWTRDQYRETNSLLLDLRSATSNMKLQGTFQKKIMASGNEAVVTAKQKGYPTSTSYNVEVKELPQAAKAASVKFTTNGLKDGDTSIGEEINFNIGSVNFVVNKTDTIKGLIARINAASASTGVTANYVEDDKSITFTTTASGANASISITGTDFGTKLNLSAGKVDNATNTFTTSSGSQLSKDVVAGEAIINGISYGITSSSFTFDGMEFNVKGKGTTTVNVKQDEDAIYKAIKDYVDKYNDIIGKLNDKISETRYRDYQPLLDDERSSMTDKQVEQWEDKAKSGLLRQDPILSGLLTQMRVSLSSAVKGPNVDPKHDSLSEIGITTGLYNENGKLYIDEVKLRKAISENGSAVMDLFSKTSTSTDPATKYSESGLAQRLYDQINSTMSKITEKAGSAASLTDNSLLGKDLKKIAKDISAWQDRLKDIEDRYWKKFTAMETAMSKANSQSSWLTQQTK